MIDNYSRFGVNSMVTSPEKVNCRGLDETIGLCKLWSSSINWTTREISVGGLSGKLHPAFKSKSDLQLLGECMDLAHA